MDEILVKQKAALIKAAFCWGWGFVGGYLLVFFLAAPFLRVVFKLIHLLFKNAWYEQAKLLLILLFSC